MSQTTASLEDILAEAVEFGSPAERQAFLDIACAGNADLRARVDQLIANHFCAGSFLERPAAILETSAFPAPLEAIGARIGPYKLLEQIGEGGMGVVYVAEQSEPVRRRVALKLIKPGMNSRAIIARFEAERQALALMDHPNIAKVLDAGATSAHHPYFVMELVRGLPITEYCDQARLPTESRLRLFAQVCRAVQHAHQKGIIHRDIKPSNVLITLHDGAPVPKVIDFGVAKALGQKLTDNTIYTQFTQLIGTPLYMSPEQAELSALDIDTRSDVYSLGVLLYELLTGTTPFDEQTLRAAGFDEMRRMIREDEPPRPSARVSTLDAAARSTTSSKRGLDNRQLSRLLRGDLDWIAMKALEKNRNRRYESASTFAADVDRYMANEPVEARPPTAMYRLRKFVRRNKGLAACFVLTLLVAVGAVISAVLIDFQKQRAERAAKDLQEAYVQIRQALDEMSSQVIDDWLARQPELLPEQKEFLSRVVQHYERLAARSMPDNDNRTGTADAYLRIGDIRKRLGENADAETAFGQAIVIYQKLVQEFPEISSNRLALAKSHRGRYLALHAMGKRDEGTVELERALVLCEQSVSNTPNDFASQYELAGTLISFGSLQRGSFELKNAEKSYVRALQVMGEPGSDAARTPKATLRIAQIYFRLGHLQYWSLRRDTDAENSMRRGIDLLTRLAESEVSASETVAYRDALGRGLTEWAHTLGADGLNRPEEAVKADRRAVAIRERLAADFPTIPVYGYRVAESLFGLGNHLHDLRQYSDATPHFLRAVDLLQKLADIHKTEAQYPTFQAEILYRLRATYCRLGKTTEAEIVLGQIEQAYRRVLALLPNEGMMHLALGDVLNRKGDDNGAIAAYRGAIRLRPKHPDAYVGLGNKLLQHGHYDEALKCYRQFHEIGSRQAYWPFPSAHWVAMAERVVALGPRVEEILSGSESAPPTELVAVATVAVLRHRFVRAAELYQTALAADAGLASYVFGRDRGDAAEAAARAGCGEGKDSGQLDAATREVWRQQALKWFRADLADWERYMATADAQKLVFARGALQTWLTKEELCCVREPDGLDKLNEAERTEWQRFWQDVRIINGKTLRTNPN